MMGGLPDPDLDLGNEFTIDADDLGAASLAPATHTKTFPGPRQRPTRTAAKRLVRAGLRCRRCFPSAFVEITLPDLRVRMPETVSPC